MPAPTRFVGGCCGNPRTPICANPNCATKIGNDQQFCSNHEPIRTPQ